MIPYWLIAIQKVTTTTKKSRVSCSKCTLTYWLLSKCTFYTLWFIFTQRVHSLDLNHKYEIAIFASIVRSIAMFTILSLLLALCLFFSASQLRSHRQMSSAVCTHIGFSLSRCVLLSFSFAHRKKTEQQQQPNTKYIYINVHLSVREISTVSIWIINQALIYKWIRLMRWHNHFQGYLYAVQLQLTLSLALLCSACVCSFCCLRFRCSMGLTRFTQFTQFQTRCNPCDLRCVDD